MDRRNFIKSAELIAAGTALHSTKAVASQKKNVRSKSRSGITNILMLFVDQQRQDCLGCYGNPVVKTPNIDRLAAHGIRFNNAYTPSPVCTPARTCLQTGLWAHNHRLMFNTAYADLRGGVKDPSPDITFFSDILNEDGWRCANIGKWHIGTDLNKPSVHGYDPTHPYFPGYGVPSNIYGYRNGSKPHPHYLEYLKSQGVDEFRLLTQTRMDRPLLAGMQDGPTSASIPSYLASMTTDTFGDYSKLGDPFFISCNFWGPHAPHAIPEQYYTMYDNAEIKAWENFDCDLSDKPDVLQRYADLNQNDWFTRQNLPELIGKYYGYISLIDDEIGRILKTLEDNGQLESTLIVYTADHGSTVGAYRMWDKGYGMYDIITRIPMIISHPSLKPGVSDAFVTLLDLAPTFLDIAGDKTLDKADGASLIPILNGSRDSVRDDYIVTEHHGHHFPFWQRMVRTRNQKFVFNFSATHEFYDLDEDPHETKNLIDTIGKTTLKRIHEMLVSWMDETKDPFGNYTKKMLYWGV